VPTSSKQSLILHHYLKALPIKSCLFALKRVGYDGMMAIEFEGMEDNTEAMRIGLANLRRYTEEIGL